MCCAPGRLNAKRNNARRFSIMAASNRWGDADDDQACFRGPSQYLIGCYAIGPPGGWSCQPI